MQIIFARHGQSEANVLRIISNRDLPHALTELGRWQAHSLAEQLSSRRVTRIYTSPIRRALQTAQLIGASLACSVETADALSEFDCGVAEGRGDECDLILAEHDGTGLRCTQWCGLHVPG